MKNLFLLAVLLFIMTVSVHAQNVLASTGNNQTSGALQQSYTLGECFVSDYRQAGFECSQGFQQPEIPQLQMRLFIQGFYTGGGLMTAVADPINAPLITDTITFSLINTNLNPVPAFEKRVLLHTDGRCTFNMPTASFGHSYFLKINHRNSIETWSKIPVAFRTFNKFDFTTP